MNFDLFQAFAESVLGKPLDTVRPIHLSGWQCVEALWPLNQRFHAAIERIRSLPYDATFEPEADGAIERLIDDANAGWDDLAAGAWRVLLERQQQALVVALANEVQGNPLMPIPPGFSPEQTTVAVALFLLHGMKLPWPPVDRSGLVIPTGSARTTLRPH